MKTVFKFFLIFILTSGSVKSQNLFHVDQKLWKPQKDEVYLQEVSTKIPTEYPITSVAVAGKNAFILSGNKLYSLENGQLYGENSPSEIIKLTAENGEIWAMTEGGIYRYQYDAWKKIDSRK